MNSSVKEIISPFERLLADLTAAGVDFAVMGGIRCSVEACRVESREVLGQRGLN